MTEVTPAHPPRGSGAPKLYDFRQPTTLTREHARALEVALQDFARQWGTLLSSRAGALTTVELDGVSLTTYHAYIENLPASTTAVVLHVEPSRTPAVLQISSGLTMTLVDCLLGGPATDLEMPFRELTAIEWRLLNDLLEYACSDLQYGLAAVAPLTFSVRGVKYSPGFMQLCASSEQVIVATFALQVGEVVGTATLMLMAEPLLTAMRSGDEQSTRTADEQREHDAVVALLADRIHDVPLEVSARLRGRTMSAAAIAALEVGDVIPLHHPQDLPLDVVVDDIVLAHGAIGAHGTRAAVLVVSTEEES